jgi:hypothetical protein
MSRDDASQSRSDSQSSQAVDPLLSLMNSSQFDHMYQDAVFTQLTQTDSQRPPHVPPPPDVSSQTAIFSYHSRLSQAEKRLSEAAESLSDPRNEGNSHFQTVLQIYQYFGQRFSFIQVLSALHQNAGSVERTVSFLGQTGRASVQEEVEFDFKTVNGTFPDVQEYFQY